MFLDFLRGNVRGDAEHPIGVSAANETPLLDAEPRGIPQFLGLSAGLPNRCFQHLRRTVSQPQQPVYPLRQGSSE